MHTQFRSSPRGRLRMTCALSSAVALLMAVAACGGSSDGESDERVVRFNFAPDETMQYMIDTGELKKMEDKWGVELEMTTTWDEFAFFAGGHGDIVSTATYELPKLEQQTDIKTVTFGAYARAKMQILVPGDSSYETMSDLKGEKIAVGDAGGTTGVWAAMVKEKEGVELEPNGGDFEMILGEHATNPELVVRGDVAACVCTPYLAVSQLRSGELRGLYDDSSAAAFFQENFGGEDAALENVFTANKEWYDSHAYEVAFFLDLWNRALDLRSQHLDELVEEYPADFSVETEEDIQWMQDWLKVQNLVRPDPFLTEEWIGGVDDLYTLLKHTGAMEEDTPDPEFDVVTPADVEAEFENGE